MKVVITMALSTAALNKMIVGKRLAAQARQLRGAAAVGQEHQQDRRLREPRHVGHQRDHGPPQRRIVHHQNVRLLEIALRGCRQRAGAEEPQQRGLARPVEEIPVHPMAGDAGELVEAGERRIDVQPLAKPFGQACLDARRQCGTGVVLHCLMSVPSVGAAH
jgi:hypothetical protein